MSSRPRPFSRPTAGSGPRQAPRPFPAPKSAANRSVPTQSTPQQPKPAKRKRTAYDLENTFEVVVGKPATPSKHFTIHTNVFTGRSGVLGKVGDSQAPVDLKAEDPELFQTYLNCVYFGSETIEQWADEFEPSETDAEEQVAADTLFEKLIRLYLLAERLADLKTANLVIGEMIRFSDAAIFIPTHIPVSLAYAATTTGSPLRKLSRDFWVYDSINTNTERLRTDGFPSEFLQDIAIEMLRVAHDESAREFYSSIKHICSRNKCCYHQHDAMHPRCGSENLDATGQL